MHPLSRAARVREVTRRAFPCIRTKIFWARVGFHARHRTVKARCVGAVSLKTSALSHRPRQPPRLRQGSAVDEHPASSPAARAPGSEPGTGGCSRASSTSRSRDSHPRQGYGAASSLSPPDLHASLSATLTLGLSDVPPTQACPDFRGRSDFWGVSHQDRSVRQHRRGARPEGRFVITKRASSWRR